MVSDSAPAVDDEVALRELNSLDDMRICEGLQRAVWGFDDIELVAGSHMRAVQQAGGLVAAAFVRDELAGFVLGFLSWGEADFSGLGMHSHMLAVRQEHRGRGLGRRLKWFQRRWCLERDISWVAWTFDPLQLKNARLNLEHFGATSAHYLPNFYGRFGGILSGSLTTDRLLVGWDLVAPQVASLAVGERLPEAVAGGGTRWALPRLEGDRPGAVDLSLATDGVRVAMPHDFTAMLTDSPELAGRWRDRVREVLAYYFAAGYEARRVVEDAYLLVMRRGE